MYDLRLMGPPDPRQVQGYLAEGQQGPPMMPRPALAPNAAPPVLDSRAMQNPQMPPPQMRPTQAFNQYAQKMRQLAPDPNKQRLSYQIGSILGPALFGKVAGASGTQAALYGVGSAAYNYQDHLDRFKKTEQEIAAAEFSLPNQEQTYDLNEAKTWRALNPAVGQTKPHYFKGANGNMWILNPDGSSKDTGVAFKPDRENQQQYAPDTYQQVQLMGPDGNPYIAMVNSRDPTDIRSLGGAGNASTITRADKAQDALIKNSAAATVFNAANDDMIANIDRAVDAADWTTTGVVGSIAKSVPGTPAHNLANIIDTIEANIGFDRLQQMRNESQTGGALGQVAVQELDALQKSIASLKQSQSDKQFRDNLLMVKRRYAVARDAYFASQAEKSRLNQSRIPSAQPQGGTPEGATQGLVGGGRIIPPVPQKSASDYLNAVGN